MSFSLILVIESAGDGGTEVFVDGLAQYMSARRPVEIVTLTGDPSTVRARFPGLETTALPNAAALRHFLRTRPGALVNLHLYTSLLPAARAVRETKAPLLITLHQPLAPWNAWHRIRWRLAVAVADHVIGVSHASLLGFGPLLRTGRRSVVSGPLPLETLPAPVSPSADLCAPRVLFVGRLSREKNLPTLLRAMAMLKGARLDVIGDGPEREDCETLATQLGLDVCFHGALPRHTVFKAMQAADIFVLPSRFEGLGIAAIEAMAAGVPTVVADFPAAAEYIIPERTGLLFPIGDHAALARCITRLTQDAALRQTLSTEGARHVRDVFSEQAQYEKYERILGSLSADAVDMIR